jgi:ABC-2 type transport system ATP-binding protein
MQSEPPILEAKQLVKRFGKFTAVNGVSFGVHSHECFGLLGPNGAGKTTTIEIMEGILSATSGQALYQGKRIGRGFQSVAGIQFQDTSLQDYLTVGETIRLFQKLYGDRENFERIVDDCALGPLVDRDNRQLSGGQRQRLLLAIALINDPSVLFLDEPTTGLDPQARRRFWDLIGHIKQRGTTIILTTHYMEEAYVLCDKIAIMDHGSIIAHGEPDALLSQHFEDAVMQLPIDDFPNSLRSLPHTILEKQKLIEFRCKNVGETLAELTRANVNLNRLRIRARDLEDLFLELTGREIRA